MGKLYLVTGAAGHLGLAVVKEILSRLKQIIEHMFDICFPEKGILKTDRV